MAAIGLSLKNIPVADPVDVLVIGGGPAGCGAALAAARDGARTALIESSTMLGGSMTSALVTVWAPFGDRENPYVFGGLARSIMAECRAAMAHVPDDAWKWVPADPEALKRIYDRRMIDAEVDVRFGAVLIDVVKADDATVSHAIIHTKGGLCAIPAELFIDCTGDADLVARAGGPTIQANIDEGQELQPTTLCFLIAGIDDYWIAHSDKRIGAWQPESIVFDIAADPEFPEIPDSHCCYTQIGPGLYTFNAGHMWDVDPVNEPASISRAIMEGRRVADAWHRALVKYFPEAFAGSHLVATAPRLGIRESRRIVGEYCLSIDDYLARRSFADEICRNNYWIDIHTRSDEVAASHASDDHIKNRYERYADGESHGIPYRCLIPQELANVLVAGRCISTDQPVAGATRTMPCSMCMGEAAGAAAAMLVSAGRADPRDVDTDALRDRLREAGAFLPATTGSPSRVTT